MGSTSLVDEMKDGEDSNMTMAQTKPQANTRMNNNKSPKMATNWYPEPPPPTQQTNHSINKCFLFWATKDMGISGSYLLVSA